MPLVKSILGGGTIVAAPRFDRLGRWYRL